MGVVARVSGPVVIAEGLENAKMFDVVRVGSQGLVGEIIRLVEKTATVQVYEDTTGVRPGDPVENTGQALSVELGPGLLKSIYDGVQRPLDVLQKSLGDFITRGFVAPPLDESKKWDFTATAHAGDHVTPGTVLGTVQETPLILHKIMVPPGVEGTIESLKGGSFTIREQIGSLATDHGKVPLYLSQKWVVRIPRPVSQKLPPSIPLVTGQRVIDSFFPVAKGGSACIPGPFGSGKCVAGETPVVLGSGEVLTMEELYERSKADGEVSLDGSDEWIRPKEPLPLYSWVGDRLVPSESRTFYKGKSDLLVRIRTRSGRTVRVTPIHRLFTFRPNGELRETAASELAPGDYIASVHRIPGPAHDRRLDLRPPRSPQTGRILRAPNTMTRELAEFLGYFVAEGCSREEEAIAFSSSDPALLERFLSLGRELFGLEGYIERPKDRAPSAVLRSAELVEVLHQLGTGGSAAEQRIPPSVLGSSNRVLASFLLGYYLGSGAAREGEVAFRAASARLRTELTYVLARFGILSTLGQRTIDGTDSYRLSIPGPVSLRRLGEVLASSAPRAASIPDDIPFGRARDVAVDGAPLAPPPIGWEPRLPSSPLRSGGQIYHGTEREGRLGATMFTTPAYPGEDGATGGHSELDADRLWRVRDDLFYDEVVETAVERAGPYDVYDVSVPGYGSNFVGGVGGMLLHNTVTQQQLARWADSDVVVYVGCGERGNEMTEVLATFPNLTDPKTKRPLMERTILIANTSNMPVAAREASVYTGITIAEYYRDMGYDVALMADSTSRWAEAMREISGRLEEMPGEEGYPAYLGRRIAEFYERAGRVVTLSPDRRTGSVTVVGAVSPPGGDFSEPVSQNTLRVTRVFWALDAALASRRHFPSINWLQSYSLYIGDLEPWYRSELSPEFVTLRQRALEVLQKESELQEIVQLVGVDALPEREKGTLDVARMIREDYLQQSAFDDVDTYTSIQKQFRMLRAILSFGDQEQQAIGKGATVAQLQALPVRTKLSRMKWIPEAEAPTQFDALETEMTQAIGQVAATGGA